MFCYVGRCTVELRSWGKADPTKGYSGYIKVNHRFKDYTLYRGIAVARFTSLPSCDLGDITSYDTYLSPNDTRELRDWLASLEEGSVVIGVSADDAQHEIDPARDIFTSLGVDIIGFGFRWRLAFITQVGRPHLSKVLVEPPGEPAILTAEIRM